MIITYDPKADAMSIRFQKGKYHISKEAGDGIIVDYTKDGKILSIEILDAHKRMPVRNMQQAKIEISTTNKAQMA